MKSIKAILLLAIALTATLGVAFAEPSEQAEPIVNITHAWVLYKYALVPAEKHRIGMEALINYTNTLGKDTSNLTAIKNQFVSLEDQLRIAANNRDYGSGKDLIRQMKDVTASFRTEVKKLVAGNQSAAQAALNAALKANRDYFVSLMADAREVHKERNLELLDYANERAQEKLDKAKSGGVDVSALQAKLDEIKAMRADYLNAANAAIESCKEDISVVWCTTPGASAYVTERNAVATKYKELAQLARQTGTANKLENAITSARKVITNGEKVLNAAEQKGMDVSVEKARLSEISAIVDSAEAKYKAGDFESAKSDLIQARDSFKSLKSDVSSRRGNK